MKISNPLDTILDSQAKIRILRFLCKTGAQWNGRQIAKEIGMTPATAHKALQSLHREGMLSLRNVGKTHLYELNAKNSVVSGTLKPLFSREGRIMGEILDIVKHAIASSRVKRDIASVALFGSVHAGQDQAGSDIDLLVIVENQAAKPLAQHLFEDIDSKIAGRFGNVVSPYINTLAEFKAKRSKGLPVIKEILQSNTVLYGRDPGSLE